MNQRRQGGWRIADGNGGKYCRLRHICGFNTGCMDTGKRVPSPNLPATADNVRKADTRMDLVAFHHPAAAEGNNRQAKRLAVHGCNIPSGWRLDLPYNLHARQAVLPPGGEIPRTAHGSDHPGKTFCRAAVGKSSRDFRCALFRAGGKTGKGQQVRRPELQ